jgi:WD40 repeat protein
MASHEKKLVSASESLETITHDVETLQIVDSFRTEQEVISMKLQNQVLYYCSANSIYRQDLRLKTPTKIFTGPEEINAIDVNNKFIAVGDDSGMPYTLDFSNFKPRPMRQGLGHSNIINTVLFRPTMMYDLITGGSDSTAKIWDTSRGTIYEEHTFTNETIMNPPFVHSLAFTKNGNTCAFGLGNGAVHIFDFARKKPKFQKVMEREGHEWCVSALAFVGDTLVSGGIDKRLIVWKDQIEIVELEFKVNCIESVDRLVAVAGTDSAITLINV